MSLLKHYCKDFGVNLQIEETIIEEMVCESRVHYPKEFGGILLGRYSEDLNTAIITDIMLPTDFKNSKVHFERGIKGIESKLRKEFAKKPSIIYLGEWHTHPDSNSQPSQTDINTLIHLSNSELILIYNPIMLIIGLSKEGYECSFYVVRNKLLYKYD